MILLFSHTLVLYWQRRIIQDDSRHTNIPVYKYPTIKNIQLNRFFYHSIFTWTWRRAFLYRNVWNENSGHFWRSSHFIWKEIFLAIVKMNYPDMYYITKLPILSLYLSFLYCIANKKHIIIVLGKILEEKKIKVTTKF